MSYNDIVALSQSPALRLRCVAGAATQEQVSDPESFIGRAWWKICAQPGWGEALAYFRNGDLEAYQATDPGANEGVITDAMILSAIQEFVPTQAST